MKRSVELLNEEALWMCEMRVKTLEGELREDCVYGVLRVLPRVAKPYPQENTG